MPRTAANDMNDSVKMAATDSTAAPKNARIAWPNVCADNAAPTEVQRGITLTYASQTSSQMLGSQCFLSDTWSFG